MATGNCDLQRMFAEQPPSLSRSAAVEPQRLRIRLRISNGQSDESSRLGEGDVKRGNDPQRRSPTGTEFLASREPRTRPKSGGRIQPTGQTVGPESATTKPRRAERNLRSPRLRLPLPHHNRLNRLS